MNTFLQIAKQIYKGNASHSKLQLVKTLMISDKPFEGGEYFLTFGSSLHELALINKTKFIGVNEQDKKVIVRMVHSLYNDKIASKLLKDTIREDKRKFCYKGVNITYILDAFKKKTGVDLKTTSLTTENTFTQYAINHGLFTQAYIYMLAEKLDSFYFIALSKKSPYRIFILPAHKFPREMQYAKHEFEFLLHIFKQLNLEQNGKQGNYSTTTQKRKSGGGSISVDKKVKRGDEKIGRKDNVQRKLQH